MKSNMIVVLLLAMVFASLAFLASPLAPTIHAAPIAPIAPPVQVLNGDCPGGQYWVVNNNATWTVEAKNTEGPFNVVSGGPDNGLDVRPKTTLPGHTLTRQWVTFTAWRGDKGEWFMAAATAGCTLDGDAVFTLNADGTATLATASGWTRFPMIFPLPN